MLTTKGPTGILHYRFQLSPPKTRTIMIKLDIAHKNFIKHLEDKGKSSSTLTAYGKDIDQLTKFLSNKGVNLVSEIALEHLEEFMGKLAKENYTPKSISRKTNSTKTYFKFLSETSVITVNIADQLKHPKVDLKAPRILSRMEYGALRDASKDDARTFAMIEVLLQTGITISEIAEIKVAHLTLNKEPGNLFVPNKNNKDSRNIPLNKAVVEAINKYIEEKGEKQSEYLFTTKTGKPLLIRNIRSTIDRFFKLAGVESAKVNDLRHTFVAFHLSQGTSLTLVSKVAGHKRVSTTERYLQYIKKSTEEEKAEFGIL